MRRSGSGGFFGHWIWPSLGVVVIAGSFGYMLVRAFWQFEYSFADALRENHYPAVKIQETTGPMGRAKTQTYYIARPKVGACTFKLVKKQFENGYVLTEINGEDVPDLKGDPTRDQAVAHAQKYGITCNG